MTIRLYLAGPMTGQPDSNFPMFDAATTSLRAFGYEVFNPAEWSRDHYTADQLANPTASMRRDYLAADYDWITTNADGIAVLPDWKSSTGARSEVAIGNAIGIDIKTYQEWLFADAALQHYVDGLIAEAIGYGSTCFVGEMGTNDQEFDSDTAITGVAYFRESLFQAVLTPLLDEVRNWR